MANLKRGDAKILARICASNGGGVDACLITEAARARLRQSGLIALKKGTRTSGRALYVHTAEGLRMNVAARAALEKPRDR
jgi:hypothetical protein